MSKINVSQLLFALQNLNNTHKAHDVITTDHVNGSYNSFLSAHDISDALILLNDQNNDRNEFQSKIEEYPLRMALNKVYDSLPIDIEYGQLKMIKPPKPLIGLLDLDEFSAYITAQDKDSLIIVNKGLLITGSRVADLVAKVINFVKSKSWSIDNIDANLRRSPLILKLLECFITYSFLDGILLLSDKLYPQFGVCAIDSELELSISSDLTFFYLAFIVSHELSHMLLGHFSETQNKQQEYDADRLGKYLLKLLYADASIQGVIFAMDIMNFIENVYRLRGTYKSSSHPTAVQRMNKLIDGDGIPLSALVVYEVFDTYFDVLGDFIAYLEEENVQFEPRNYRRILEILYEDFCP